MPLIDRFTVQKILDTAQIVDVVSDFVSLKRAGANFKGLCPFHDDRTPSFMVSPAKNYCKCFACGKGGSPVGFIMEHEQLSYPEALKYLAHKYHIDVQERELTDEEKRETSERESMFVLNQFALEWFENQLYDTPDGQAIGMVYFRHRGFRDDIIRKFRLGYSPSTRDALYHAAKSKGFNPEFLLKTGLVFESQNGGRPIDRFHGRVIFPIFNVSGKVCGFGGRVLDAATKGVNIKYQNSPESAIYSKKRELYGLYQAKQAIVKADSCFLVEGYTDVMAMHQMGVENVVASSGTALTTQQIALIHRLTPNIVVIYDGDAAGIKASQRGIDMLLEAGMNVRLLLLPDGDDPDSFARKHNAHEYQEYLSTHQVDFIGFKTSLLLREAQNDPIKLSRLAGNIVESISRIPDPITRSTYVRQAAQMLQMDEKLIATATNKQVKANQEQAKREKESQARREALQEEAKAQSVTATQQPALTVSSTNYDEPPTGYYDSLTAEEHARSSNRDYDEPPTGMYDETTVSGNVNASYADNAAAGTTPQQAVSPEPIIVVPKSSLDKFEREIMRVIIKYGDKDVCLIEDENGQEKTMTAIQYIAAVLNQDNLQLENALYNKVLQTAIQSQPSNTLPSTTFFINHPDPEISALAFEITTEDIPLSRTQSQSLQMRSESERLYEIVPLVMSNYKLGIVDRELKALNLKLRSPEALSNRAVAMQVMQRYSELKRIQTLLAKECGERVLV